MKTHPLHINVDIALGDHCVCICVLGFAEHRQSALYRLRRYARGRAQGYSSGRFWCEAPCHFSDITMPIISDATRLAFSTIFTHTDEIKGTKCGKRNALKCKIRHVRHTHQAVNEKRSSLADKPRVLGGKQLRPASPV